jgi:hypothetical protein
LVVTVVSSLGVSTVISFGPGSSQYQLSLNAAISPSPTPVGGIVSYNPLGAPIPTGSTLTIQRVLPENQLTSFSGQGTLWPTVVESTLDYITMVSQQLQNLFGNFFQAPSTDPVGLNYTAPAAAQRASQALGFDGSGNLTTFTVLPAGTVSSAMAPVVNAASIPIARTALGLGAMATEGIGAGLQDDGANNARVIFTTNAFGISTAITSANYLQKLKLTGPLTLTLPRANTFWNGFGFWVEVLSTSSGPVTIAINAADQIEANPSGASLIVPPGANFFIATNAAASGVWWTEISFGTLVNATPPGVFKNLVIKVATSTTVTASADFVSVTDGANYYTISPSATINAATSGLNGLDTGALTIDSWYYVWAIYNPITQIAGWMLSLQSTANGTFLAALPSGFKAYGRYGAVQTIHAAATFYGTWQLGRRAQYISGLAGTTVIPQIFNGATGNTATPVYTSFSLTRFVPTTAGAIVILASSGGAGGQRYMVAPNNTYGNNTSLVNPPPINGGSDSFASQSIYSGQPAMMLLESNNIFVACSSAVIAAFGWEDNL